MVLYDKINQRIITDVLGYNEEVLYETLTKDITFKRLLEDYVPVTIFYKDNKGDEEKIARLKKEYPTVSLIDYDEFYNLLKIK